MKIKHGHCFGHKCSQQIFLIKQQAENYDSGIKSIYFYFSVDYFFYNTVTDFKIVLKTYIMIFKKKI